MNYKIVNKKNIRCITFSKFEEYKKEMLYYFTTRHGGVSKECFNSLNLGLGTNDNKCNILKNYEILGDCINININDIVMTSQTHTANIMIVEEKDKGKGILRKRDYENIDGLITNIKNIPIATTHADCVPLVLYDYRNKVIGVAHSGWRGTLKKIGEKMIQQMCMKFNCNVNNIVAGIGPSLCQKCFEVDEDVAKMFINIDKNYEQFMYKNNIKYYIDLWKINEYLFIKNGITKENIQNSRLCTKCNMDLFFSHRGQKGERGIMASIAMLI